MLSLNGCRVAEAILRLIPDVQKFRLCLGFIKLWARERGIYSSAFGYLPGVSWAILVARVCQLYQTVSSLRLIQHFFYFYGYVHRWPQPVLLTPPYYIENLGLEVWNPQFNVAHRFDVMPIITPAYPFMNSTYNVSQHTLFVIQGEFRRAYTLFCESHKREVWDKLHVPSEFFKQHTHYIHLTISANNKEQLNDFLGWVHAKVRHLLNLLATPSHSFRFRPFPHGFMHSTEKRQHCNSFFIGLCFSKKKSSPMNEIFFSINHFKSIVYAWHKKKDGMEVESKIVAQRDLPTYVVTPDKDDEKDLGSKTGDPVVDDS